MHLPFSNTIFPNSKLLFNLQGELQDRDTRILGSTPGSSYTEPKRSSCWFLWWWWDRELTTPAQQCGLSSLLALGCDYQQFTFTQSSAKVPGSSNWPIFPARWDADMCRMACSWDIFQINCIIEDEICCFFLDVWHKGEPLVQWFDASAAQISIYVMKPLMLPITDIIYSLIKFEENIVS